MDAGIASDGTDIPSSTLKAKLLNELESNKGALEELVKVLKINTTLYAPKTVHELVISYEMRSGQQLSLKKWKYIFRQLGCLDCFHQHVADDQRGAVATDMDNVNCNPSSAAKQRPRNDCDIPVEVHVDAVELQDQSFDESREFAASSSLPPLVNTRAKQTHGAIPKTRSTQQQNRADVMGVTDGSSANQLAVYSEVELIVQAMTREAVGNIEETDQNPSESWPLWSLPPPEQKQRIEKNATNDAPKGNNDHDSAVEVGEESGLFSVEGNSQIESSRMPSINIQLSSPANVAPLSLVLEVDEPDLQDLQCQNAGSEIEESDETHAMSSLRIDSNQQSDEIETPSRPTTPEGAHSLSNPLPLTTGHHRSVAGVRLPVSEGPDLNNGDQEHRIPAEHYDSTENNGLLESLQKEIEFLRLNESFLVQKLREKETECANVKTRCYHLQHELEESRRVRAQQQVTIEELSRCLEESTVLEAESQRLIRMSEEMRSWKEQECDRMEQHIRQLDHRYDSANCRIEDLRRENREVSEELRSVVCEVQELQLQLQEQQNLQGERERVRMDSERLLDERMAEVSQAFHNAETDEVKMLKKKLRREKSKRKRTEDRNKSLLKENCQLQALIKQLRSKKEEEVPPGDTREDDVESNHESYSTASSEEEEPGTSTHGQQQDSSEDSG